MCARFCGLGNGAAAGRPPDLPIRSAAAMAGIYNDGQRWTGEGQAVTTTTGHDSAASADAGRWLPAATARCRFCAQQLNHTFVDLGMSPLCQTHIEPHAAQSHGAVLSAARLGVRQLLPRAARGVRRARRDLPRLRLLLVVLRQLGRARARATPSAMIARLRLGREVAGHRDREQRRLPAAALRRARHPVPRHRAGRERRARSRSRRASRRPSSSSAQQTAERDRRGARPADLLLGNNVLAHVPDINDFVGGMKIAARSRAA